MIIIVHGLILTPSSNNWAASVGCNGGDPPVYLQFLRFLLLLPCSVLLTKNPQKVSKDERSAIFEQKHQSCLKELFHLRMSSILWWFWSSFDYKHKNISAWASLVTSLMTGTSCVCQLFTQTADFFWMSTNFEGVKVCTHENNWAT
jgi:hypothetical protein